MTNKFNLGDIVKMRRWKDEYRIIGLNYETYLKPKKIWCRLYRLSDGYVCEVCESIINKVEEE